VSRYGYTLLCEQPGPKDLVANAQRAEDAGFEFAVISDHYFPWLDEMKHSLDEFRKAIRAWVHRYRARPDWWRHQDMFFEWWSNTLLPALNE
jgi:alkanesulfonate monooxygenase SsuD/methylene tetrahydromethanopterin reductase-like flavin-dependent oxidoreductase (luciferase family)